MLDTRAKVGASSKLRLVPGAIFAKAGIRLVFVSMGEQGGVNPSFYLNVVFYPDPDLDLRDHKSGKQNRTFIYL
jgi:hypothetical protein